ncbi:MAG TPA: trypsin-like peptidase domain-containing protein [Gemmatimonadales bacterium]|nr:trypsin-like peptidase domain-containing protein [Gemmatimonadales bacterium]
MKAHFKFLSGARAGQAETIAKAYIGLGRHPLSDVRFDTERDLDVSTRHAAIVQKGDHFVLSDQGSTNGTLVNGKKITGDVALADGDVIGFGPNGPSVEFHVLDPGAGAVSTSGAEAAARRASQPRSALPAAVAGGSRSSTAVRIAMEVAKQTKQLRHTTKVLFAALLVIAGGFGAMQWKAGRDRAGLLADMQAKLDSMQESNRQALAESRGQIKQLQDALAASIAEVSQLQGELARAGTSGDASEMDRLRQQLDAAEARQRGLAGATAVDYRDLSKKNQDAVALVYVEYGPNDVVSGTAWAIDSQGTLITNKHVLTGDDGDRQPQRIAVKFSGSKQWFPGRYVGVADSADLGILKVDIVRGTPRVQGVSRDPQSLQRGDPIAIIGYPLGTDLPMMGEGLNVVADPTLTVGTVSKVLPNLVQVDGYGAPGSSGSPIFDREGKVVAVLYGGQRESNGKIIFAVPASYVLDLARKLGVGK